MNDQETNEILQQILHPDQPIIEAEEINPTNQLVVAEPTKKSKEELEIEQDADAARTGMHELIEQGSTAIRNLQQISAETMHPRAFEVLNQLLKTQSETFEKLLKIQKEKRSLMDKPAGNAVGTPQSPINVEQAVFVGSTSQLLKQFRNENKET
jgi:DNA polymerase III gamma/tau subunit